MYRRFTKKNSARNDPDAEILLRKMRALSVRILRDEFSGVAKCLNGFSGVVRDLDAELFFESHDQLNSVEAVCAQIVDEAGLFDHFVFFNAKMLDDDFFNAVRDIAHEIFPFLQAGAFVCCRPSADALCVAD
jgi:hypothetical protein